VYGASEWDMNGGWVDGWGGVVVMCGFRDVARIERLLFSISP